MKHITLSPDDYEDASTDDQGNLNITLTDDAAAYLEDKMGR